MAEPRGPQVYSIAAHRGFADALVAGLVPRYADDDLGLAKLTLLLPSSRAMRAVTDAFIRHSGENGLLLPRMAAIGDLDLDEALGPLLDPLGAGDIPPAIDPQLRLLKLAVIIREERGEEAPQGATLLRMAAQTAQAIDRLNAEQIDPSMLMSASVLDIVKELAEHWQQSTRLFLRVHARWAAHLDEIGAIDASVRRNQLFDLAAKQWKSDEPKGPVVAAGVTSAAPALARLLRVVSEAPRSAVILPDFDLTLDSAVWDELGIAGAPNDSEGPFGRSDAVTHPQYHLKLLLNRMGIARGEVQPWHRKGLAAADPDRSHALGNLFLPPQASRSWAQLPASSRRLARVKLFEAAHPGEEAQAIAIAIREAMETPGKRVALVTPDRDLASRVVAHLARWNIIADDSAGKPLDMTPAGRILLLLAEIAANDAPPVPLFALLGHPLVAAGEGRRDWLAMVRALELRMRGPRQQSCFAPYANEAARLSNGADWWSGVAAKLGPITGVGETLELGGILDLLVLAAEALCGDALWGREDGRALSAFVDELRDNLAETEFEAHKRDLPQVLRELMTQVSVRPPYGGHPRVAIYGLLESRMTRADLVICGGLNEGVWPAASSPDPLLPPPVLRALGVPGADFRIGLSAHDLASAMGAPDVLLTRARRDMSGPTIPSRFLLRAQALMGASQVERQIDGALASLTKAIDDTIASAPYGIPEPNPSPQQRRVTVSVTNLDRLRSDPFQFYANAILGLRPLEGLDEEPSARWQGIAAHAILEKWHNGEGALPELAEAELRSMGAHIAIRSMWRPRLLAALEWVERQVAENKLAGRTVSVVEGKGNWEYRGVTLHGRADRIDTLSDGTLAIVDYKIGKPPTKRETEAGYRLQLGTLGLIAGGTTFRDAEGNNASGEATVFEYWSLGKDREGFGYMVSPIKQSDRQQGLTADEFLPKVQEYLDDALDRWILGDEPFAATVQPDLPRYTDYDQLMRLEEWLGREDTQQ